MASKSSTSLPKSLSTQAITEEVNDEVTPLFSNSSRNYNALSDDHSSIERAEDTREDANTLSFLGVLSVLFIGVFISQADTSLVLATYGTIASEFNDLQNASWLMSAYMLAMCVGQPLYGKLSDIFGRKAMLQISYGLFAIGSGLCGLSQSMWQLVGARAIQGIGGGGMITLVSILITDLVPLRQVATWRSYVNVVQTVGRSSGGAVGGILAQFIGWRWTLAGQAPLVCIAIVLVWWKLQVPQPSWEEEEDRKSTLSSKMKRIDFIGALFLSSTIICLLLMLDVGGKKVEWTSITIAMLGGMAVKSAMAFAFVEKRWAKEPIFPLHLLSRLDVITSYSMIALQNASQTSLMFFIPLYFEVTKSSTAGEAGTYMIPSIVGNTSGGLLTGFFIKRYGHTKSPIVLASVFSSACFVLLFLFWNGSDTPEWMSTFTFLGGFGTGMAHSSLFVALAAGVGEQNMAIAGSGLYLCGSVGAVSGMCAASALFQSGLRSALNQGLDTGGIPNSKEIIRKAVSDIGYVQHLRGRLRDLVVGAYVSSFHEAFIMCIGLAAACFLISLVTPSRTLSR